MNRAERRRRARQGLPAEKEPVYSMRRSDIERNNLAIADTVMAMLLAIPIKVMHEKYGWGMRKRLPELADALTDEYQRFADGDMSLEEYQDYVYEHCGMKFQRNE